MANSEHVEVLRAGTAGVRSWRSEHADEPLDGSGAELSGVNLAGADLRGAWLVHADLSEAVLDGADLTGAVVCEANLRRARLNGALLPGADLSNAYLKGAELSGAVSGATFWNSREVSSALGLDEVVHQAPSYINLDMVLLSAREWPLAFLRGCGLPEQLIAALPEFTDDAAHYERAVIWTTEQDREFGETLIRQLRQQGIRCWAAAQTTSSGDRHSERWMTGQSDTLLVCLSQSALDDLELEEEVSVALLRETLPAGTEGEERQVLKVVDIDGSADSAMERIPVLIDRIAARFGEGGEEGPVFRKGVEDVVQSLKIPLAADSVFVPPIAAGKRVVRRPQKAVKAEAIPLDALMTLPGQADGLLAGFRRLTRNDGGNSVWFDDRGEKQPTHHLRQLSAGNVVEWETAVVPRDGEMMPCFVWGGSFGGFDDAATDGFSLCVNGEDQLIFDLTQSTMLWKNEEETVGLLYDVRWTSPNDSAGFFYLGLSPGLVTPGRACRVGIRTVGIDSERWVGVIPVEDPVGRQVLTDR